jgi:hypothetical protein
MPSTELLPIPANPDVGNHSPNSGGLSAVEGIASRNSVQPDSAISFRLALHPIACTIIRKTTVQNFLIEDCAFHWTNPDQNNIHFQEFP